MQKIFAGTLLFLFLCIITVANAQTAANAQTVANARDSSSPDGLLACARTAAFGEKDYGRAKGYLIKALGISPGRPDIRIFLGRICAWGHVYDSARSCFEYVLRADPRSEDAAIAYADLEVWNDHEELALKICRNALGYLPSSEELLLREAKIFLAMKRFPAADSAVQKVLTIDKDNAAARSLGERIRELSARNRIGITYDFVYFDRQFDAPWHLLSMDYGRVTKYGTVTGRINYANRFKEGGIQYELEAYPHISKRFYGYMELGYAANKTLFPSWRGGFSLYSNLPAAMEAELGFRYLQFSGTPTWIYTAYFGKYYKNWLFGARAYLTPATYTPAVSLSYSAMARYYYGTGDDLIGISGGYGISPDDRYNVIQLNTATRLISYNMGFLFKKKIGHRYVLSANMNWLSQEYLPHSKGNQYQAGLAWLYRF